VIFVLRGVWVGAAVFGVLYCLLSVLIVVLWRGFRIASREAAAGRASLFFLVRVTPFAMATILTLFLALPAFFRLEGAMDEDLGTFLFSGCTVLIVGAGVRRVLKAERQVSHLVGQWMEGRRIPSLTPAAEVLQTKAEAPPLLLQGIWRPKVLISDIALATLNADETKVAIGHEVAHLRARDNFKKLILLFLAFPGMRSLDRAWQESAELDADADAVATVPDALNLATALVKLCGIPARELPMLTTGFNEVESLVKKRVQQLLSWNGKSFRKSWVRRRWMIGALVLGVAALCVMYHQAALAVAHAATERVIG
jgi:Zn-dependent protease with chaperone function